MRECTRQRVLSLVMAWAAALMLGCGGGGSGDSSTVSSASSEGPIAGFGSVIMNGVRWNTDSAEFEVEGRSVAQQDLSVGMVVRIEGSRSADGSATADRVIFESILRGPIHEIEDLSPDTRALTIFGLRALVSRADTQFDDTTLDALATGQVVELSGLTNVEGDLEASHLRLRAIAVVGITEVKATGIVEGLAGGSFVLGTSEIVFDESTLMDDFGAGGLRDGLRVRVEGILLANDAIQASEIESPRGRGQDDRFDEVEFQGIVSDFVSDANFEVADRPVDASGAVFIPDDPDLLRNGVRVEVEGRIDGAGVLIADKLKIRSNRVRVHAEVASDADVYAGLGELLLLGIPIHVDGLTRVRDQRDGVDGFGLEDLLAGDFVEVRGIARSDGTVMATRLELRNPDDLLLRGPVDMIDRDEESFTIRGVLVRTRAATVFRDANGGLLSSDEFFSLVESGRIVAVKADAAGDVTDLDFASEVEIEDPDLDDDDDDRGDDEDDDDDDDDLDGSDN